MKADFARRFGGVNRLYGEEGAQRIFSAHVAVIGIGGVGSWAAEAFARSGVGRLTLIDLDMVAESNTNRQIHAHDPNYGKAKVDAMAERIHQINPECELTLIEDFATSDNLAELLKPGLNFAVDAIDQTKIKAAMIAHCKQCKIPLITAGAAGGQFDPTQILIADLSQTTQDPLLSKVRSLLRREYGFPRGERNKFNVPAIYSTEQLHYPDKNRSCETNMPTTGLNCAGFGSSVCVTASFGMAAAAHALRQIAKQST